MSAFRSGILSTAVHGSGLALRLGFLLALVHFTSPAVVGLYGLAVAIETVAVYLAGLEFHTFTARRYAPKPSPRRLRLLIHVHCRLLSFTAPLTGLVGVVAASVLNLTSDAASLAALAALLISGAVAQEFGRYLVLAQRPVQSVVMGFLRASAWQPATLPLLSNDVDTLRSLLWLWAGASIFAAAWGAWQLRLSLRTQARVPMRYVLIGLRQARAYYGIATASVLQSNLERFILQWMLGPAAVGIFSFFQTMSNTLSSLVQAAVFNVALPNILSRFGQRAPDRQAYLQQTMRRALQVSLLVSAATCAIAVPIMLLIGRQDYSQSLWMLPLLAIGQTLMIWTQPIHLALYAARHDRLLIFMMGSALLVAILLDVLLISLLGVVGAVIAPVLVGAAISTARRIYSMRLTRLGTL